MVGNLKFVKVAEATLPVVIVRLNPTDIYGQEQPAVLEYELPTNFRQPQLLTNQFAALQIQNGIVLGFLFNSDKDCRKWSYALAGVHSELEVSAERLEKIKN